MNRAVVGLISLLIIVIAIATFVYKKSSFDNSGTNKFYGFLPANFASQIIEISDPSDFVENLFNSNLLWKDVESDFEEFTKFWNNTDSSFIEIKNKAEKLLLFENGKDKYYVFKLPYSADSLDIPSTFSEGNFILFSTSGIEKFKKSFEEELPLYKSKSFTHILSQKTKTTHVVKLYLNKAEKWNVYELNFLPERIFASGNILNTQNNKEYHGTLDEIVFDYLPSQFQSATIYQFDSLAAEKDPQDEYYNFLSEQCKCDAFYNLYNWQSSPTVSFVPFQDTFSIYISKIKDLSNYNEGLRDLIPDSLSFEGENKTIYSLGSGIKFDSFMEEFLYVLRIDEYAYFGSNKEQLEKLNFRVFSGLTLSSSEEVYKFVTNNLNKKSYKLELKKGLNLPEVNSEKGISIFQESSHTNTYNYSSFVYSKEISIGKGIVNPKWEKQFSSPLSDRIYIVKNHRTSDINYVVQDENNILYFISPNGEIAWKKNVKNPVLGEIKNIDFFGNNKNQLIFNTKNELYILDVLGRNVGSFPVSIKDSATGNVSVMDYDKDLDYRFLVPTSVGIKNVNKKGNLVSGWMQPMPKNQVKSNVTHLLINGLDYLVVKDIKNKLSFYNRKGEERHKVEATFGEPFYLLYGSTIKYTRALFLDTNENTISRQFFDDKPVAILLSPQRKIEHFFFVDYNQDNEREFVLVFEGEIVIYGQDLIIEKKITLPTTYSKLLVWEKGFSYINEFNELILVSEEKKNIIEQVEDYQIDTYKNRLRIVAKYKNGLKMLYIN